MKAIRYVNSFLLLLYILFITSNLFSFRAVTSISLVVIIITGIVQNKLQTDNWVSKEWKNPFFIACCIYFFIHTSILILTPHIHPALSEINIKTAIVFAPLCLCVCGKLNNTFFKNLMDSFVWISILFEVTCLSIAAYHFFHLQAPVDVFFYHALVSPFKQHAVYVSILIFIALIHLFESVKTNSTSNRLLNYIAMLTLIIFILLLSSKLVITFMVFSILYYLLFSVKNTAYLISLRTGFAVFILLILIGCISLTDNPIGKRFKEVIHTNLAMVQKENFTPNTYFDGIQFRLLEWRFVEEILDEKSAWWTGVSSDAQSLLNAKYKSTNMYIGNGKSGDQGYINYNTHNQFLESALQSGILGLLAFIILCAGMIYLAIEAKSKPLTIFTILLLIYALNESILERQYGIIIFTFFPLLLYRYSLNQTSQKLTLY